MDKEKRDAVREGLSGLAGGGEKKEKKKGGKTHVHEIHVKRARNHNGSTGYMARHDVVDGEGNPVPPKKPEDAMHMIPDMAALHEHMDQHMGDGGGDDEQAEGEGATQA